jgi:hypothetical protein
MLAAIAEFTVDVILNFFLGTAPERPVWLRRLVQAFWMLLLLAFLPHVSTASSAW